MSLEGKSKVKMSLEGKSKEIDIKLNNLGKGEVLDVPGLSESDANNLVERYKRAYFVIGPNKEDQNSTPKNTRYVIAIMKKSYGDIENA